VGLSAACGEGSDALPPGQRATAQQHLLVGAELQIAADLNFYQGPRGVDVAFAEAPLGITDPPPRQDVVDSRSGLDVDVERLLADCNAIGSVAGEQAREAARECATRLRDACTQGACCTKSELVGSGFARERADQMW
jgi:hypothetical protein